MIGKYTIGYYNKSKAFFDIFINIIIALINVVVVDQMAGYGTHGVDFSAMNLFFLIEIILNFQQGFKDQNDIEIYDRRLIRKDYLKTIFCLDFFPFLCDTLELIFEYFIMNASMRAIRLVGLLRLLKLPYGKRNRRIASAFSKTKEPNQCVIKMLNVFVFIIWVLVLGFGTRAIFEALENKLILAPHKI